MPESPNTTLTRYVTPEASAVYGRGPSDDHSPPGTSDVTSLSDTADLSPIEQWYRNYLQTHPGDPAALHALAAFAYRRGDLHKALELITEALRIDPNEPIYHNTCGVICEALNRLPQALDAYRRAITLKPDYAEAHHNMAIALQSQGHYQQALECCRNALQIEPNFPEACNTQGFALQMLGDYHQAIASYERAIQLRPDYAEAYNHLGVLHSTLGNHAQAIACYCRALDIDPDYAEAHWNKSLSLLLIGQLQAGWQEYRWRYHPELQLALYPHKMTLPRWDGSPFAGKTLLVHYEQGLGDTIHFIRYLPMVKARGGTVVLEIQKPLVSLLQSFPGADQIVEASLDKPPSGWFDLQVSLMDLPAIFQTSLDNVPADVPYIFPDPHKVAVWRRRLAAPFLKVGIIWSGSTNYQRNHLRSCCLDDFAALAQVRGVRLFSLQKGSPRRQLAQTTFEPAPIDLAEYLHDFSDTAAVLANLDLIVSVDTSVLHLAGAMGRPTWALLSAAPEWRWLLERSDSPWYPTVRLFRQKHKGQWGPVFQQVAAELQRLLCQKRSSTDSRSFA